MGGKPKIEEITLIIFFFMNGETKDIIHPQKQKEHRRSALGLAYSMGT